MTTETSAITAMEKKAPEEIASLFTPWKIGKVEIKNRIVLTSMGGTNLLGWMEKNHFDEMGARFIQTVAENHVGLLLPGCQPVYNPMFGQWLYKNERMYDDLAKWMPKFHQTGAKLFVQLTAGFGRSFTISPMMEKLYTNPVLRFLSKPVMNLDKITASASAAPNRWSDKVPSRAMTIEEIQQMVEAFGKTAKLLKNAGVDGVEVHAVHEGYLLDQFTLPYINHRTDAYGGSGKIGTVLRWTLFVRLSAFVEKIFRSRCGILWNPRRRDSVREPFPAKRTRKLAEIWTNRVGQRAICKMLVMTCSTATTARMTLGIGAIRRFTCLKIVICRR